MKAEEQQAKASAKAAEATGKLDAAYAEAQSKLQSAAATKELAKQAATRKTDTANAAGDAKLALEPVAIYISRATQTLYVRRNTRKAWPEGGEVFDASLVLTDQLESACEGQGGSGGRPSTSRTGPNDRR